MQQLVKRKTLLDTTLNPLSPSHELDTEGTYRALLPSVRELEATAKGDGGVSEWAAARLQSESEITFSNFYDCFISGSAQV